MKTLLKQSSLLFIIVAMITSTSLICYTQTLYVSSGATIQVTHGGHLYVQGNTIINGKITNDDTITLTGDLVVTDTYVSTGVDIFSGPSNQIVNSAITGSNYFGHIVKNNTGKLIFQANTDCDSITFSTDDLIDLTSGATLKVKTGLSTSIKGYNSLRYFDIADNSGALSRLITTTSRLYVWPIGNQSSGYKRFDFIFSNLGTTGISFVSGKILDGPSGIINYQKFFTTGFNGNFPGQNCSVGTHPQWVGFTCMTPNYHQFSGPLDYQHTVFSWSPSCDPVGNGPRRVLQSPAGSGFWSNNLEAVIGTLTQQLCENSYWAGGSTPVIPGGTYRGFGDFAIAAGYNTVLPIELVSLTATPIDNKFIRINWETASEQNNAGFEVQRSIDGINWNTIAWADGKGTISYPQTYELDDHEVTLFTTYYYRLRQVDFDNSFTYSDMVTAELVTTKITVGDVYPNPGKNEQWISLFLPNTQTITLKCFNMFGKEIWIHHIGNINGKQNILLPKSESGVYLLTIVINNEIITKKFVKN